MPAAVTFLAAALCAGLLAAPAQAEPPPPERFVNIAHRGASGLAPEHTIPAWDLAIELGADYLEQDVHLTRDGVLVVLHDDTLDRTARGPAENCTGPVRLKTWAQLQTCDVGTWFNERYPDRARPEFEGLPIPSLAQVFERYGADVAYYIETKTPEAAPGLVQRELLRLLDLYDLRGPAVRDGTVLIQSFSPAGLRIMHALDPALPLIQLLAAVPAGAARDALLDDVAEYAVGLGPSAGGVTADLVTAAHDRCLAVHPYTVDDAERLAELVAMGVDGVFTNRPDTLTEVLGRDLREERPDAVAAAAHAYRRCRAG
jgi:glycerophosphoryl diester phosphodiesterase